ncbi:hypothetical protein APT56_23060 [Achromobacter denitrificans]|nr:hypothetical protein APT56_23060 [Achromobacter denitrificans]
MRSGAFAPDYPFVILVLAFGDSFGFPRAHLHAPHPPGTLPPPLVHLHAADGGENGLLGVLLSVVWGAEEFAGPA